MRPVTALRSRKARRFSTAAEAARLKICLLQSHTGSGNLSRLHVSISNVSHGFAAALNQLFYRVCYFCPQLQLPLAPTEAKIEALSSKRDELPDGRQIHALHLT